MNSSPTSVRKQRNREATIQTILDAARAIMREEGVAALSMQELARRMDMRAPSLYNYFSGKMDIYDALFRLGFTLYAGQVEAMLKNVATLRDEIRVHFEAYLSFAIANPELYQLCFERPVPGFVPSEASLQLSFGILQRSYERAERTKSEYAPETDLSAQQIVDLVIAMSHGLTAMHLANEPHLPMGQGRFGSLIPVFLSILEKSILVKGEKK